MQGVTEVCSPVRSLERGDALMALTVLIRSGSSETTGVTG